MCEFLSERLRVWNFKNSLICTGLQYLLISQRCIRSRMFHTRSNVTWCMMPHPLSVAVYYPIVNNHSSSSKGIDELNNTEAGRLSDGRDRKWRLVHEYMLWDIMCRLREGHCKLKSHFSISAALPLHFRNATVYPKRCIISLLSVRNTTFLADFCATIVLGSTFILPCLTCYLTTSYRPL